MDLQLTGTVALVTGGTRGIGRAVVEAVVHPVAGLAHQHAAARGVQL